MSDALFDPLPDFYRKCSEQNGYVHFGKGEMTVLDTYACASCGASDRERLCAYWLRKEIDSGRLPATQKVIHFAPEKALAGFIRSSNAFADYQTADFVMDGVDHKVDLMNLPFADNSYDFFICSHVLEHVPDDLTAIQELCRITRPGGRGILMAPVITDLPGTIEDPSATSEIDRWRLFGQYDHVRLYAHDDYVNKIIEGGFVVHQLGEKEFGPRTFAQLGLKSTSILYIVIRQ